VNTQLIWNKEAVMRQVLLNIVLLCSVFAAAAPAPPQAQRKVAAQRGASARLTLNTLANMAYPNPCARETVRMFDGRGNDHFWLDKKHVAFGDLNGDGVEDAVVVLACDGGGSGGLFFLTAVLNRDGKGESSATKLLGDRVNVSSMSIRANVVTVNIVTHGPDDPMCCPTKREILTFGLQHNTFISYVWNGTKYVPAASPQQEHPETAQRKQRIAAEKRRLCEGACITVRVVKASLVTITTKDANGYTSSKGIPIQRLIVAVGGQKKGDGMSLGGHIFEGNGATADVLCLQNCFDLTVGSTYRMRLGRLQTHMRRCYAVYGDCWDYDNLPYLSIETTNGIAAWQILELCSGRQGEACLALSSVNSR
jgi:hypothetical protein